MTTQPRLLDPGTADGNLSARQAIIYEYLQAHPRGMLTIDIGRHLHMNKTNPCLYCSDERICQYAARDANQVLDSLRGSPQDPRARRLVVRRRETGRWQLVRPVRVALPDDPDPFKGF
jgi:hypothetical protein